MSDDLLRHLARLIKDGHEDGLSAEEIADVLWMARHLRPAGPAEALPSSATSAAVQAPAAPSESETPASRGIADENHALPLSQPHGDIEFHPISSPETAAAADGRRAASVRGSAVTALPDALAISRALRPLKRLVPRSDAVILAEEATSAAFGETKLILPVWRPGTERWLQMDLVVDTSTSMAIWRQAATELRKLIEHHGAFRNVRTWAINSDLPIPRIVPFSRRPTSQPLISHSAAELIDPGGRRAVLVVTDAVRNRLAQRCHDAAPHDMGTLMPVRHRPRPPPTSVAPDRARRHSHHGTNEAWCTAPLPRHPCG